MFNNEEQKDKRVIKTMKAIGLWAVFFCALSVWGKTFPDTTTKLHCLSNELVLRNSVNQTTNILVESSVIMAKSEE